QRDMIGLAVRPGREHGIAEVAHGVAEEDVVAIVLALAPGGRDRKLPRQAEGLGGAQGAAIAGDGPGEAATGEALDMSGVHRDLAAKEDATLERQEARGVRPEEARRVVIHMGPGRGID